jgi:rhodanese-related sulfurtransferase
VNGDLCIVNETEGPSEEHQKKTIKNMFNLFASREKAFENLSGRDFKEAQLKSESVLLDVRTAGEFASGTIKGAKNIDMMSPLFKEAVSTLDKNKEYFVFCRSGNRSAQACSIMARQGFKVRNLDGGIGQYPA